MNESDTPAMVHAKAIRDRVVERQKDCVWIDVDGSPMILADSWPDARSLLDAIHTAAGLDGTETDRAAVLREAAALGRDLSRQCYSAQEIAARLDRLADEAATT